MGNNPGNITKPKLNSPISGAFGSHKKEKKNKGNQPWIDARKRIRKDIFG